MIVKDKNKVPIKPVATKTLGGQANISIDEVQAEVLKITGPTTDKSSLAKSKFPIDAIPETFRNILLEYHQVHQLPIDYFGLTILVIAGGIMGNAFKLKYKYQCPPLLYAALVGNSSMGKTPAIKILMRILNELEKEYDQEYKTALKDYLAEMDEWEKGDKRPIKPKRKELVINNATTEAIIQSLSTNHNGLILFQDELLGWINNMNQYRSGGDEQFWLSTWSNSMAKNNRVTKETVLIPNSFVNVIGGIQPELLPNIAAGDKNSSGFWFRILFAFPPNQDKPHDNDLVVSEETNQAYERLIKKLISWRLTQLAATQIGEVIQPKILEISSEATTVYKKWKRKNTNLTNESDNNAIKSIYGKLADYCLRLALILEILDCLGTQENLEDFQNVSKTSMKRAIQLTEYFRKSSLRVFDIIGNTDPIDELSVNQRKTYHLLPEQFKTGEGVRIISKYMAERTFKRFLNNTNLFKKLSRGYFEKLY